MKLTQEQLRYMIKEEFDAVVAEKASKKARRKKRAKVKKKKAKKAGGGDRCTRIAKRKYDVWPSAYASGAVVKCRQGKIWKGLKEVLSEDEFKPHMMYNPKTGDKKKAEKHDEHEALAKKGYTHVNPKELEKILDKEGGAAGLKPMVKGTKSSEEEVVDTLDGMDNVGKHKKGDYIKDDGEEIEVQKEMKQNCGCGQDPCITYGPQVAKIDPSVYPNYYMLEATYEDGTPVEEDFSFLENLNEEELEEAVYAGKTVPLNKPMRGDIKKFKVYVNSGKKDAKGRIKAKKVNFGHGGSSAKKKGEKTMKIRKNNPKARKNFRARHNCANPGPKTKARYWSCRKW
jgi:hypothetical protein